MKEFNDFLLNLYTGRDEYRPFMYFPNLANGYVHASDSHALIAIPESELCLKYSTDEKYPNTMKLINEIEANKLTRVKAKVSDLAKELTKARIEVDKDSIKCNECDGNRTVEFNYIDKQNKEYSSNNNCPVCDGDGAGSKEKDNNFARICLSLIEKEDGKRIGIEVGNLYFHPFQLYKLFMVALLNKQESIEIYYDADTLYSCICYINNIKVVTMLYKRPY